MILIADSGSTKCSWVLTDEDDKKVLEIISVLEDKVSSRRCLAERSFLRELEFQENIILLEDIDLRMLKQQNAKNIDSYNKRDLLQVNIKIKLYGKN